jgi:hypothetical protein
VMELDHEDRDPVPGGDSDAGLGAVAWLATAQEQGREACVCVRPAVRRQGMRLGCHATR